MDPITLALAKKYTDKKIEGANSGEVSWNDLKDKPFGVDTDGIKITGVGEAISTVDDFYILSTMGIGTVPYIRFTDYVPNIEQLEKSHGTFIDYSKSIENFTTVTSFVYLGDDIVECKAVGTETDATQAGMIFYLAKKDNATYTYDSSPDSPFTFPKAGLYTKYYAGVEGYEDYAGTGIIESIVIPDIITPIPTEYLPEHLQFGEETEKIVIFETKDLDDFVYTATLNIAVGEKYFVNFDGVIYECVVRDDGYYGGASGLSLGNMGIDGMYDGNGNEMADTGEPFIFFYRPNKNSVRISTIYGDSEHTIEVYQETTNIETLNPKYLPKMPVMFSIAFDDDGMEPHLFGATYDEIADALNAKMPVYGVYYDSESIKPLLRVTGGGDTITCQYAENEDGSESVYVISSDGTVFDTVFGGA